MINFPLHEKDWKNSESNNKSIAHLYYTIQKIKGLHIFQNIIQSVKIK